jgi:hypothetical protein
MGIPPCMSFRYNKRKQACNQRMNVLSSEEFQKKLSGFRFRDERYVGTHSKSR